MEVSGERITALANGELHAERNIYQSPTNNNQPGKILHSPTALIQYIQKYMCICLEVMYI